MMNNDYINDACKKEYWVIVGCLKNHVNVKAVYTVNPSIEMHYIVEAIHDYFKLKQRFPTSLELVDKVFELEGNKVSNGGTSEHFDELYYLLRDRQFVNFLRQNLSETRTKSQNDNANKNESSKTSDTLNCPRDIKALKAERDRLKMEMLCKNCFKKDAVMLLLPCGHLSLCEECVENNDHCPLTRCKSEIKAVVRTYKC